MNPIEVLLNHRSIREFKKQAVSPAQVNVLLEVAKRTATSTGMQTFSIIQVVDQGLKDEIAKVCQQPYVARMPELFIFVADAYRNAQIAHEQGISEKSEGDSDRFFQGWTDAVLAAQNMVAAAELAGFGTVFLGSILNDVPKMIELLNLPKLTFPVLGVGLGVPDQEPQLKPRMPRDVNVFTNQYQTFDGEYMDILEEYDEEMSQYYDLRDTNNRVDCFTLQVVKRLQSANPSRQRLIQHAEAQGFLLDMDKVEGK